MSLRRYDNLEDQAISGGVWTNVVKGMKGKTWQVVDLESGPGSMAKTHIRD
jgi:hypothetical protein